MDITVAYAGADLIATRGEEALTLPSKMSFLIGAGPQRTELAFADALRGKYPFKDDDLKMIRRWMR